MNAEKIKIGKEDALVVIDMQNDFVLSEGALFVKGVEGEALMGDVVDRVKDLMSRPFGFNTVPADIHPPDHIEVGIFGPHCIVGTDGSKLYFEIEGVSTSILGDDEKYNGDNFDYLIKGQDKDIISYSASTSDNWLGHIGRLRRCGIKRIFLCGLAYTHCVGESAISYASQGFEVYVVRNATRSVTPPYGDPVAMNQKLALYGVKLVNIADLV